MGVKMTDIQLFEFIYKQENKTATLTKLKYNKAIVEIYFNDSDKAKYRFKFTSVHSAKNFINLVGINKFKEIDNSKK